MIKKKKNADDDDVEMGRHTEEPDLNLTNKTHVFFY